MGTGCRINQRMPAFRYAKGQQGKRPVLGTGMLLHPDGDTLFISDLHFPYHHPDALEFIFRLDQIYDVARYVSVGDMYDNHGPNFHTKEPDAYSPELEYIKAKECGQDLQSIIPNMDITPGNHCDIPKRKAKEAGLPLSMLSDYNKLYDTEDTWVWHEDDFVFDTRDAIPITIPMKLNARGRWNKKI